MHLDATRVLHHLGPAPRAAELRPRARHCREQALPLVEHSRGVVPRALLVHGGCGGELDDGRLGLGLARRAGPAALRHEAVQVLQQRLEPRRVLAAAAALAALAAAGLDDAVERLDHAPDLDCTE